MTDVPPTGVPPTDVPPTDVPPTDVMADYAALRREAGLVELPRDVVAARGPDTAAFLQGQLSQDLDGLHDGASTWSFVLQPQGKVDAFVRVTRLADDEFLLDTDGGWGDALTARLERFKLRTKVELERLPWTCLAVRGPDAHRIAPEPGDGAGSDGRTGWIAAAADWPGLPGVDVLGPASAAEEALAPAVAAGLRRCSLHAYDSVRIEAGVPAMGRELDERTIPQEAGLVERAVSFTKGCYTGQELVARIDSRGHVNRHLRGVVVATNVVPPVGAAIVVATEHDDDAAADAGPAGGRREVGVVTSVGESLDRRAPVALAYVRREVEPPAAVSIVWDGGEAPAQVEALPLVAP